MSTSHISLGELGGGSIVARCLEHFCTNSCLCLSVRLTFLKAIMLSEFEKLNGKMVFGQFKKGAKNLKDFDCKHSPIVKKISYLENINKTLEL